MMIVAALILGAVALSPPGRDEDRREPTRAFAEPLRDEVDEAPQQLGHAQPRQEGTDEGENEEENVQPDSAIVITGRRLDAARTQIDAGLGASVYSLTNETIENRPGGETGSISQILTQAPGVSVSGNALNIRGSRANQVRINNVIVPEVISDPAEHLSSRLAETTRLITGTLPAQFGFAPAGVISVTTKNGLYQHGGQAEVFAGSDGMLEPAIEWAGSARGTSLFASGSLEHDRSPYVDAQGVATSGQRNEIEGLAFADHVIDENSRLSLLAGGSRERRRMGPTTIGTGTERSSDSYAVGTFQRTAGALTIQSSLFAGAAAEQARFLESTYEHRGTFGTQVDATDVLSPDHILRFGLLASRSWVRELDFGHRRSRSARTAAALYVQDQWKITPSLTFNPGVRLEWLRAGASGARFEPRASLVHDFRRGLTAHIGYARYAAAAAPGPEPAGARLPDERDDYFDAGIQLQHGPFTIALDGYWRSVRNFTAEHETIGSAGPVAFAFRRARLRGLEVSATYSRGPVSAWANLAFSSGRARTIIGGEGFLAPMTIAAASRESFALASERPVVASGGLTWRLGSLSMSGDMLASSGAVRTIDVMRPNGSRYRSYAVAGFAAVYHARIAGRPSDLRLDVTNLTDAHYVTSDAANIEGGWTRRGRGRAITIGTELGF